MLHLIGRRVEPLDDRNKKEKRFKVMSDPKTPADVTAIAVGAGALMEWLPAIASLFTIVWMAIRIYETDTVKRWFGKSK